LRQIHILPPLHFLVPGLSLEQLSVSPQPQMLYSQAQQMVGQGNPPFGGAGEDLFQVVMCFRPKRRASMDHAPGPIIPMVAPRMAMTIGIHGSLPLMDAIHSSTATIKLPATGVHNPMRRSIPAQAATNCGIIDGEKDVPAGSMTPKRTARIAISTR